MSQPNTPSLLSPCRNKKAGPTLKSQGHVKFISLRPRQPPVSVADLALMLELDLLMGHRVDFIKRLQSALDATARFNHPVSVK